MRQELRLLCMLLLGGAPATAVPFVLAAQSPEAQLCDKLALQSTREQARPQADRLISAGGPSADFLRGCLVWDEARSEAAVRFFEAATKHPAATSDHWLWLGNGYGVKAQRANPVSQAMLARKVKAAFERAVQLDGSNVMAREGLLQFYLQAPGVMGGSMDKAQEQAQAIAQRNPYRGGLARITVATRRKDDAATEQVMKSLRTTYPDSVSVISLMANWLTQRARWPELWSLLDAAGTGSLAGHLRLSYLVGRASATSGQQLDRGITAMTAYLAAGTPKAGEPRTSNAQWRLGQIHEHKGNTDLAKAAYRAALADDPSNGEAKKALKKLGA